MAFAEVNQATLYYEIQGTGPRLLVLLGSGSDLRHRPNIFNTPLAQHFELLTLDQRGQGRSSLPHASFTMADYAQDIKALLDSIGWASCAVLGISFGGMVAQELAALFPSVVERLILACSSSGGQGGSSFPMHTLEQLDEEQRVEQLIPLFDIRWKKDGANLAYRPKGGTRRLERIIRRLVQADSKEGATLQLAARKTHDTFERLTDITCPVWLCGGLFDAIAPPLNQYRMLRQMKQAHLTFFKGGHLFYIDDPEAFPRMTDFLLGRTDPIKDAFERSEWLRGSHDWERLDQLISDTISSFSFEHPVAFQWLYLQVSTLLESRSFPQVESSILEQDAKAALHVLSIHGTGTLWGCLASIEHARFVPETEFSKSKLLAAVEPFSEDFRIHEALGGLFFDRKMLTESIEAYTKVKALTPFNAKARLRLGELYVTQERYEDALFEIDESIRQAPWNMWAFWIRSKVYEALEQWSPALADLDFISETFSPNQTEFTFRRVHILKRLNRLERMMQDLNSILANEPENTEAYVERAHVLLRRNEYDKAIEDLDEALRRESSSSKYFFARGWAKHQKGDLTGALADYNNSLCYEYYAMDALNNRGLLHYQQGRYSQAYNDFNDAIHRSESKDAYAFSNRAMIYVFRGQLDSAIADYDTAISLESNDADLFYNRGLAKEHNGALQGAIEDFQASIKLYGGEKSEEAGPILERIEELRKQLN